MATSTSLPIPEIVMLSLAPSASLTFPESSSHQDALGQAPAQNPTSKGMKKQTTLVFQLVHSFSANLFTGSHAAQDEFGHKSGRAVALRSEMLRDLMSKCNNRCCSFTVLFATPGILEGLTVE